MAFRALSRQLPSSLSAAAGRLAPSWSSSSALLSLAGAAAAATSGRYLLRYLSSSSSSSSLAKKAVLITGCDSGFGFSLALHCQQRLGMTVVAGCYNPGGSKAGEQELRRITKDKIFTVPLDVTCDASISACVARTEAILAETDTQLWCVVNNAATLVFAETEWQTRRMISRQLDVNVVGPLAVTKAFLPILRTSRGRLVNLISFCTDCPLPTLSVYTASKGALRSASAGLRMELAKFGVDVVMLNPGDHPSETPLCYGQDAYYEEMASEVSRIPDHARFDGYFADCRAKFCGMFGAAPPTLQPLDNPGFYKTFEAILTAERPRAEYTNSDVGTRTFFGSLSFLPVGWSDRLRTAMMRLPKWQDKADKLTEEDKSDEEVKN